MRSTCIQYSLALIPQLCRTSSKRSIPWEFHQTEIKIYCFRSASQVNQDFLANLIIMIESDRKNAEYIQNFLVQMKETKIIKRRRNMSMFSSTIDLCIKPTYCQLFLNLNLLSVISNCNWPWITNNGWGYYFFTPSAHVLS